MVSRKTILVTGGAITGLNAPLPIAAGGTGGVNSTAALNNLGAVSTNTNVIAGAGLTGGGGLSANITLSIASGSNGYGNRYISTGSPSGGNNGDIWYQI
jgi:hypothetical protein